MNIFKKIFGKRINDYISLVFQGKPVTIKPDGEEDMQNTLDLVRKASTGDKKAEKALGKKITKPIEEALPEIVPEIKQIKEELQETQVKHKQVKSDFDNSLLGILSNDPNFEIRDSKYYLKGFQAELPIIIAEKFAQLIKDKQDIDHLIKFWSTNLLNDNEEARRGLYKFITKQKLIVASEGYFVAFRRLNLVQAEQVGSLNYSDQDIAEFNHCASIVKGWKKSTKNFEIYKNPLGDVILFDTRRKKKLNDGFTFIGRLDTLLESLKIGKKTIPAVYTDNHTKKMVIRLNEPVRIPRSECDENGSRECSKGLHVGSEAFVSRYQSHGTVIVAVLVNAQHVVSVPYADAHKMRVCEYMPFMVLTPEELKNFGNMDIHKYELQYKAFEKSELQKALAIIDNIDPEEMKEFQKEGTITLQDVNILEDKIKEDTAKLKSETKKLSILLNDKVSKSLNLDEIRLILKNRLK